MLLKGIISCIRTISFRMFPIFPQLQVALPAIQRTPMALMNPTTETKKQDFVEWLQESYLQFATPKKRTSLTKRRLRRAPKNLQPKTNIVVCPICGKYKLLHHLCNSCVLHNRYNGETREY